MALQDIVEQICLLINKDWSQFEHKEVKNMRNILKSLSDNLFSEIENTNDTDCLEEVIDYENEHFFLPIPCVIKLYQRLIFLDKRNKLYYESFVDYLLQYGPDWEEEGTTLTRLYTSGDFEKACDFAQKVEHYKDFRN
ncbi:hypothetical protein ACP8HI_02565 [Paenibacillus sp. FA6]|uniref:hypothetical protein n=1 Tax=Paenibacillus sp. FA6 TaxID=3413029 RepID=UPI003F659FCC